MQAVDSLLTFRPGLVGDAANQEFGRARTPVAAAIDPGSPAQASAHSGWDPHEVWRRMIKEPRDRRLKQDS